ncbi:MAG: hypothetical protein WKF84_21070 [Pyrinomonadaceae bacterium]
MKTGNMKFTEIYRRQIQVARVYGIPVRIDYRWFLVFALTVWLISAQILVLDPLGIGRAMSLLLGIITTAMLFLSIFRTRAFARTGRSLRGN